MVSIPNPQTDFSEAPSKWGLPPGAKARIGRGRINEIAYSPDGNRFAVATSMGIWLYDAETGEAITLIEHKVGVWCVAFSPDGKTLAGGDHKKHIYLWDVETGRRTRILTRDKHDGEFSPRNIAFSLDGQILVVRGTCRDDDGGRYGEVDIWDVVTGEHTHTLREDESWYLSSFISDSQTLIMYGDDQVCCWDVETGNLFAEFAVDNEYHLCGLDFYPDGKVFLIASKGNTVYLWEVEIGMLRMSREVRREDGGDPVLSPGMQLQAGHTGGDIYFWGTEVGSPKHILTGHNTPVSYGLLSPDRKMLASMSGDSGSDDSSTLCTILWDMETGARKHTLSGNADFSAFSPNGKILVGLDPEDTVSVWDVETGARKHTFSGFENHPINSWSYIEQIFFCPGSRTVVGVSKSDGGTDAIFWDVETGIHKYALTGEVCQFAFSPNGKTLATGGSDGQIQLWDIETGKEITSEEMKILTGQTDRIRQLAFSPDGKTLVSVIDFPGRIELWDVETGAHKYTLTGYRLPVDPVAFSPDGKLLVSAIIPTRIELWDVQTGKCKSTTRIEYMSRFEDLTFSPDGKTFASRGFLQESKTASVLDVKTGIRKQIHPHGTYGFHLFHCVQS